MYPIVIYINDTLDENSFSLLDQTKNSMIDTLDEDSSDETDQLDILIQLSVQNYRY